ncbi:MAG: DNA mismatch repair endonuclease MutL [Planctomycetia bacterium]|nr:DNA mismatch repair endonuclease MutL [Planctomycetia bacterium]
MNEIKQLSANMINKIAAGEVIERPASVVKELVENSIDAGAKRIEVVVERSGFDLIRIQDDGCGISADQIPFALMPHATSKIVDVDDLFNITTFGFRGEALASVAEISQFLLRSRVSESSEGTEIRSDGGNISGMNPCGMPTGTIIDVRNIFFNIPARRKYLKSVATEFGHISEAFMRLAIPQIGIHFILKHNGRIVYDFPPVSHILDRISALTGKQASDKLLKVECSRGDVHISGYIGHPDLSRHNASFQYFFLNQRYIKDRSLQHALMEAYRGLMTVGRHPVAFLELDVPTNIIDVNVHPTKLEVRFLDSHLIYSNFLSAVREQLLLADLSSRPHAGEISNHSSQFKRTNSFKGKNDFCDDDHLDPQQALDPEFTEEMRKNFLQWSNQCAKTASSQEGLHFLDEDNDSESETLSNESDFSPSNDLSVHDSDSLPFDDSNALAFNNIHSENDIKRSFSQQKNKKGSALSQGLNEIRFRAKQTDSLFSGNKIPEFVPFPDGHSSFFSPSELMKNQSLNNDSSQNNVCSIDKNDWQNGDSFNQPNSSSLQDSGQELSDTNCQNESKLIINSFSNDSNKRWFQTIREKIAINSSGNPVLQIHQRYLIMESTDGLAIIDQHALHERILYEKIKAKINQGRLDIQRLLLPETVDLTPNESACALDNKDFLADFGLLIDSFGGNTIVINGYPSILRQIPPHEILLTLIEPIIKGGKKPDRSNLLDEMMHQMACKAAVKAGDLLRNDAITELLALAEQEINAHHCPHGRPSTLIISCKDIDKLFKRT